MAKSDEEIPVDGELPVDAGDVKGTGVVDGKKVLPDIPATIPFEVPAVEAVTYDKWWINRLIILANSPKEPLAVQVNFVRAYADKDGIIYTIPNQEGTILRIDDLLNEAAKDSELGDIVRQLLDKIQAIGVERGVL